MIENKSNIKSFSIYGLFGNQDVHIPFDKGAMILIGENGMGKTTILNMLYYVLSRQYVKLARYSFKEIILSYCENKQVKLNRNEVHLYANPPSSSQGQQMLWGKLRMDYGEEKGSKLYHDIVNKTFFQSTATKEIIHFPTFRRVEEELHNLGLNEKKITSNKDNRLIQFGMKDISDRFDEITEKIAKLSNEGYEKISSEILSQLVKGLPTIDTSFLQDITIEEVEITLNRLGNKISIEDKEAIKIAVKSKEIEENKKPLIFFLQKLTQLYQQQKEFDHSIREYRDVCNKYLRNKRIIYDESKIEIYLQSDIDGEKVELKDLSSGEKQIISIFSRIYLNPNDDLIVLFDEPELSLSIIWQEMLIPDILASGKCAFLLAFTHSPFIFEHLEEYADNLGQFITYPKKPVSA